MRINRLLLAVAAPAALAASLAVPAASGATTSATASASGDAWSPDCRYNRPPCVVYCYVSTLNRYVPCGVRIIDPIASRVTE